MSQMKNGLIVNPDPGCATRRAESSHPRVGTSTGVVASAVDARAPTVPKAMPAVNRTSLQALSSSRPEAPIHPRLELPRAGVGEEVRHAARGGLVGSRSGRSPGAVPGRRSPPAPAAGWRPRRPSSRSTRRPTARPTRRARGSIRRWRRRPGTSRPSRWARRETDRRPRRRRPAGVRTRPRRGRGRAPAPSRRRRSRRRRGAAAAPAARGRRRLAPPIHRHRAGG